MRICFPALAVILFAIAQAAFAQKDAAFRVAVVYVHPDKFTDVSNLYRDGLLDELRQHLQRRAERYIPEHQRLTVTITDIDMAGRFEPWRAHAGNVRIVRDVYPPRVDLIFKLAAVDGTVLKEGLRELRNPAFMQNAGVFRNHILSYEKVLLDDWLGREFAPITTTHRDGKSAVFN